MTAKPFPNHKKSLAIIGILFFGFCFCQMGLSQNAEIKLNKRVIHPRFRENPRPAGGVVARQNPPIILIPLTKGKNVTYDFRLSQDSQFPNSQTTQANDVPYGIFNVHWALKNGDWFWQWRANDGKWSEVQSFKITSEVPVFETPTPEGLLSKIASEHPRVLVRNDELSSFRSRNKNNPDAAAIIKSADKKVNAMPPPETTGIANPDDNLSKVEKEKLALDASKNLGSSAGKTVELFCKAFALTGNKKYARAAIRWAKEIARWDPNGVSAVNNFGDSKCMIAMAYTYDTCHQLLSSEEKELLLESITVRGERFYHQWINMLEAKIFSGHVWQHILERLFKTSIATLHEIPQAKNWLSYIYEVWLARAPCLGPDDGGWWNGAHYFELNTLTLLDIPMFLNQYTGINFIRSPFYQNNPFWLIYSFPANSYSEGFGNGTEKQFGQKLGVLGYADVLSRLTGNRYAAWYVDYQLKAMGKKLTDDDEFRWFRLKWQLPDRPEPIEKFDLPLARAFRETGTVNMHSNLLHPDKNLMVSLRSSPYGSTSHAHSDQNSFNIQYGGEKLFYNSGYRPSMGVPHYTQWFKASIGHNTVLIDGKGQPTGSSESYGWIARFSHGKRISYCLGDASKAYDNVKQVPQKAGVKRFRRHLIFLRPSLIVIYDELEADHKAEWSWLLHSPEKIDLDKPGQQLFCQTKTARSQVNLFGSEKLNITLSTKFHPKAVNYRNLRDENGNIIVYKDQWHIYAKSMGKTMRYLAIFQIKDKSDRTDFVKVASDADGNLKLGPWTIQAELDVSKPASFKIINAAEKLGIMYGKSSLQIGDNEFTTKYIKSTLLVEPINGELTAKEAIDQPPVGRD